MTSRSWSEPRRAALALLKTDASRAEQAWACEWMRMAPAEWVVDALAQDLVDQLVLEAVETHQAADFAMPRAILDALAARKWLAAATVLVQERVTSEACSLLESLGVEYVVFKGALMRQVLYAFPHLRPSVDVDLLVPPDAVQDVLRTFERQGYAIEIRSHSETHEASLIKSGVALDLHWHLLRPGRMRNDLTCEILRARTRYGPWWGPNESHLTAAMLVHPAITEHVTGKLVSAVDLDQWLRRRPVPWDEVLDTLNRIGLKTAAWMMLVWIQRLFATPLAPDILQRLSPSPLRRHYLERWLDLDPGWLYARQPLFVRGAFSLALQDRSRDAAYAIWTLARNRPSLP